MKPLSDGDYWLDGTDKVTIKDNEVYADGLSLGVVGIHIDPDRLEKR